MLLIISAGVAVMTVMVLTTMLVALVMVVTWDIHPCLILLFLVVYLPLECLYLSATLVKIPSGGWVALVVAATVSSVKMTWWYGQKMKGQHTAKNKVSSNWSHFATLLGCPLGLVASLQLKCSKVALTTARTQLMQKLKLLTKYAYTSTLPAAM